MVRKTINTFDEGAAFKLFNSKKIYHVKTMHLKLI